MVTTRECGKGILAIERASFLRWIGSLLEVGSELNEPAAVRILVAFSTNRSRIPPAFQHFSLSLDSARMLI
jgi:hypothetical protein